MSQYDDGYGEVTENLYSAAILNALEHQWDRQELPGLPIGTRIFIRWIDRTKDNQEWQDWRLAALIHPEGLEWIEHHNSAVRLDITDAIWNGMVQGKVVVSGINLTVWWCVSNLDGPHGERVVDWLTPPPGEAR
jgi:hypothetical protein